MIINLPLTHEAIIHSKYFFIFISYTYQESNKLYLSLIFIEGNAHNSKVIKKLADLISYLCVLGSSMNKNYTKIVDNDNFKRYKKLSLISGDEFDGTEISYPNAVFTIAFQNDKDCRAHVRKMVELLKQLIFDKTNSIRKLYIGLTDNEETVIDTLKEFLKIRQNNNRKFDIILLEQCKNLIAKTDFYIHNQHHFILEGDEKSKENRVSTLLNVLSNVAISSDISEVELKLFTYLFGSYCKSMDINWKDHPAISYSFLISIFEKTNVWEKKIIKKSLDRLSRRGLVELKPVDGKKSDLRLINFNFFNHHLQFGTLK